MGRACLRVAITILPSSYADIFMSKLEKTYIYPHIKNKTFQSGMLRIHSIQPNWWDVEKVIQSNPVSYVDKCFIYMWYNPLGEGVACKYILHTGNKNLAGSPFYRIVDIIPSIYLFIYLSVFIYIFPFFMTKKIYVVREHFAILNFNKYLVFEQALPWQER